MRYQKPELREVSRALALVRGGPQGQGDSVIPNTLGNDAVDAGLDD